MLARKMMSWRYSEQKKFPTMTEVLSRPKTVKEYSPKYYWTPLPQLTTKLTLNKQAIKLPWTSASYLVHDCVRLLDRTLFTDTPLYGNYFKVTLI